MARSYKGGKVICGKIQLIPEDEEWSRNASRKIKT